MKNKQLKFLSSIKKDKELINFYEKNKKKNLKIGTDCSGIEAPIHALDLMKVNYNHIFSSEINENCIKVIEYNHKPKYIFRNIMKRNHKKLEPIDIYICGFPCQSFSSASAGKRLGFEDKERGNIFFHCFDTIKYTKPKVFILENVKGLTTHDNGNTFKIVMEKLNSLKNYIINYNILNTKNYGIPQNRPRIYIVGINKKYILKDKKLNFPPPTIDLKLNVDDLMDILPKDKHIEYSKITPHMKEILKNKKVSSRKNWIVNINSSLPEFSTKMENISPCLLAGNSAFYVSSKKRRLTEKEALRLQGFSDMLKIPSDISKSQIYKQAGNTMSVNVLIFIFREIFKILKL